jgi:uncharacterized protein (DUF427 family)
MVKLSAEGFRGHVPRDYIPLPALTETRQLCGINSKTDPKGFEIMKLPGPDHPIAITANPKRIRVLADGVVIADTQKALTLKEASYPAVQYLPREDAHMELLQRTDRVTHCPYKGDASYFSINANGKTLDNAIWTYETPFPAMAEISGYLAFYPDKVKIEEVA